MMQRGQVPGEEFPRRGASKHDDDVLKKPQKSDAVDVLKEEENI